MPILDALGLRLAKWLAPALRWMGVDPVGFVALVDTRLKLGRRRVRNDGRPSGARGQAINFLVSLGAGCFGIMIAYVIEADHLALTGALAVVWVFVGLFQALEVGSLLFDPAEAHVVLPSPMPARTAYAARLAHGLWGQGWLLTGSSLPLVLYGALVRDSMTFALIAPFAVLGIATTTFALLVGLLLVLARGRDPSRLQSIAVYVQVGLLTVFYVGLQFLGGRPGERFGSSLSLDAGLLSVVFPPSWYGAILAWSEGDHSLFRGTLIALGLAVPVLAIAGVLGAVRLRHLAGTLASGAGSARAARPGSRPRGSWVGSLAGLLGLRSVDRAGFECTGHLAGREHPFRQRTWPSLVYPLVFGGGTLIRDPEMARSMAGIWVLMPAMLLPAILINARYTRDPGATWMLHAAPVQHLSLFQAGSRRLFLLLVAWLPSLFFGVAWAVGASPGTWPRALGTVGLSWGVAAWIAVRAERRLPFTEDVPTNTRPEGMAFVMVSMFVGTLVFMVTLTFQLSDTIGWVAAALGFLAAGLGWRRLGRPRRAVDRVLSGFWPA